MSSDDAGTLHGRWRFAALLLGLALCVSILLAPRPDDLSVSAQRLAALTALMATWWMLQPVPIAATSLLPMACYPLLGISSAQAVCRAYGDQNIFLFLGGFLIAIAIERWNLHRRIALHIISRVGASPRRIVLGFMFTTALLSMWISNTASTLLMLPIGLALVSTLRDALNSQSPEAGAGASRMTVPLLLGIAYAASCGGFATLIGTPTNISLRGFWERQFVSQGYADLEFAEWMLLFGPVSLLMLLSAGLIMCWNLRPLGASAQLTRSFFRDRLQELGPTRGAEWRVLMIFGLTAGLWILRKPLVIGERTLLPDWPSLLTNGLSRLGVSLGPIANLIEDSTIAVFMALWLFILPGDRDERGARPPLLSWSDAERRTPWGMLLLFGGGFAMADAFSSTGLSAWLGGRFAEAIAGAATIWMVLGVCLLMTFLTEFTSNTATVNTVMPILAAMALQLKIDPRLMLIPAAVSASCAFMLPVATPPNAIVFSSGFVPMRSMLRYGIVLNLLGVVYVTLALRLGGGPVMGIPWK